MRLIKILFKHHYLVIILELALAIIFLILLSNETLAQSRNTIEGVVFEKESEMPLPGAHILIEGSSLGTISGPEGNFRLSTTSFPITLKVTHIGYEDRYFTVTEKYKDQNLMLGLNISAEMLDGITISDKKAELIFKDEAYSILDFEFHENGLILLIFRNRLKQSELVLLSTLNDTLAKMLDLPGKAQSLHRDCRNYIHYSSLDSAYQIHFTGDSLKLIHPVHMSIFGPVANAFSAYHDNFYYFAVHRMHKQIIDYIRYDSVSETYVPFRSVIDPRSMQMLKDNPIHHSLLVDPFGDEQEFTNLLEGMYENSTSLKDKRDLERDLSIEAHYLRKIIYTPLYAPLFKNKVELILFNHPASVIEFITPYGKLLRATHISHHEMKDWEPPILKDEIFDTYYAIFKTNNRISLRSIDIHTGMLGPVIEMAYPFIRKILVRNGYAYFTYRQPGSDDRTMLFRQKLNVDLGGLQLAGSK